MRLQLTVERVAVLIELGRLAEATAAAEQGVELARLAGNPPMLLWARCALSSARLAAGDVGAAVQHAEVAAAIVKVMDARRSEAFVPRVWAAIMPVVRMTPEALFQKLKFLSGR